LFGCKPFFPKSFQLFFFDKINTVKPSQTSGRVNDDGYRESLSVLRQDVCAGHASGAATEGVFDGVPEGPEK
jgi:hypothetical protein